MRLTKSPMKDDWRFRKVFTVYGVWNNVPNTRAASGPEHSIVVVSLSTINNRNNDGGGRYLFCNNSRVKLK